MDAFEKERAALRPDVLAALEKVHDGGIIGDWETEWGADYAEEVSLTLRRKLEGIEGAEILWEHEPYPGALWQDEDEDDEEEDWDEDEGEDEFEWDDDEEGDDDDWEEIEVAPEDLPDDLDDTLESEEPTCSYHRVFLAAQGADMRFKIEESAEAPESAAVTLTGEGVVGCLVGVSLLEPFAVVLFETFERYGDDHSIPDVFPPASDLDGDGIVNEEDLFSLVADEGSRLRLRGLHNKIVQFLEEEGITVLPGEELRKPTPWLAVAENVFAPEIITVRNALFVRQSS